MGGLVSEQGNLLEMLATLAIVLAWLFVVPFVAVSLYLSLEILFGLKALPRPRFEGRDNLNIAVLVPAHDEASGIASTVAALRSAMPRRQQALP